MKSFYSQVLTTKEPDIKKWRGLVNKYPSADIYFTPDYAMVLEATDGEVRKVLGGEAQLFFYGNEQNSVIYPFFKRNTSEFPFYRLLRPESKDWFDIASPYGYSGPIAHLTDVKLERKLWKDFFEEFYHFCVENNIVTEFVRFHPYINNHLPFQKFAGADITGGVEVVYINLEQDKSSIRKNMTKGHRSSVSKAQRSGVEVFCSKNNDEIDSFYRLYIDTMKRNKAKKFYFFSRKFFDNLFCLLDKNVELFIAWYSGRIIAASIFLFQENFVHYFLAGSDIQFLHLCPNNLILYEAILWAKKRGYKIFNLGGGYGKDDSLFLFKASFSKTAANFYTYSKIHCKEMYEILCQAKNRYDRLNSKEITNSDYFPEYRR